MFSLAFLSERSLYLKFDTESMRVSICETKDQDPEIGHGPLRANYTGSHHVRIIVHSLSCAENGSKSGGIHKLTLWHH